MSTATEACVAGHSVQEGQLTRMQRSVCQIVAQVACREGALIAEAPSLADRGAMHAARGGRLQDGVMKRFAI
jgi:hypothetical protein